MQALVRQIRSCAVEYIDRVVVFLSTGLV